MLITGGNIHDGLGKVFKASLRVENGLIAQMGEELEPKPGEEIFDAAGMEILPGFVAGAIAAVIASLATRAPSEQVEAIYASATSADIDD